MAFVSLGSLPARPRRQVVVTGIGMVTPLAHNAQGSWERLLNGCSGTKRLSQETMPSYIPSYVTAKERVEALCSLPAQVVAPVEEADSGAPGEGKKGSKLFDATSRETRAQRMAMHAVREAWQDAQQRSTKRLLQSDGGSIPNSRAGVNFGVAMAGLSDISEAAHHLFGGAAPQPNRIVPYFVPKALANTVGGSISQHLGLMGPNHCSVTACATGAHCLGDAARWIQNGDADVVVAGAAEACITPVSIAGFCRMKALATKFNETPESASRPFCATRNGFVMGEGSGAVVLETLESALDRGAPIYAELRGYGLSGDAHHPTSPHPDGLGVQYCIESALNDAACDALSVSYVNAHATGTPQGDEIELETLTRILRGLPSASNPTATLKPLVISSSKGAFGHLLGAAGAVEAIVTILALQHQLAPPNINLFQPIEHDTRLVTLPTQPAAFSGRLALSTSFGFGGTNAALLFAR